MKRELTGLLEIFLMTHKRPKRNVNSQICPKSVSQELPHQIFQVSQKIGNCGA